MCGFNLERQHSEVTENTPLSQTTPAASPSQSPRQEVPQSPEPKIRRTSLFMTSPNKQPSLPSSMAMEIKQAIPITMYETTASVVIIVHNGVTGSADANSVTLKYEGPPLLAIGSILHTNEMMLNHNPANTSTDEEPKRTESKHYVRIVRVPKAIDPTPTKTEHGSYVILDFKKVTNTVNF